MNESSPAPANLLPPSPERELMGWIAAHFSAGRSADQHMIEGLQAQGEEGQMMQVVRYVAQDCDERYVPKPDGKLPVMYEKMLWKPEGDLSFNVREIVLRTPLYETDTALFLWPNDVLINIKLTDRPEQNILLNGFGWKSYSNPNDIKLNEATGDDSIGVSQNVLRMAGGAQNEPTLSPQEVLVLLKHSEHYVQIPTTTVTE